MKAARNLGAQEATFCETNISKRYNIASSSRIYVIVGVCR